MRMESKSYVIFISARDDAEDAIDSMDGRTFEGRELRVQLAK